MQGGLQSARGPTDESPPQGGCATILCQPLDVLKTRLMNSKGEYQVKTGFHAPGLGGVPASYGLGASSFSALWSFFSQRRVCFPREPRDKAVVPCSFPVAQLWVALAWGWGCTFPRPWPWFLQRKLFTQSVESIRPVS